MGADKDGEVGRYAISTIATSDELFGNLVAETIIDTKTGYIISLLNLLNGLYIPFTGLFLN